MLSESAGACEQLGPYALCHTPTDLEGTMQALYRALTLSQEEKGQRAAALRRLIEGEDANRWLCWQLEELVSLSQQKAPVP